MLLVRVAIFTLLVRCLFNLKFPNAMCTQATGSQTIYTNALLLVVIFFIAIRPVTGDLVNYTIDDQYGDQYTGSMPVYTPLAPFVQGDDCSDCKANLNPLAVFDGTWHDATIHSNIISAELTISMNFTGVALYAFCIIPNTYNYSTFANYTFSIDGDFVGSYQHLPDGSDNISYQVPVYTNTSLTNATHEFTIHIPQGSNPTLILFDYVIYTQLKEDNVTTSQVPSISTAPATPALTIHNHPDTASLAGGIGGGLAFLILITCTIVIYNRRQKNRTHVGHRPSFKESPPSPVRVEAQTIVQLPITTHLQIRTSFEASEVLTNHSISARPPNYQHKMGRLLQSGHMQTFLPLTNNSSPQGQVHHGPTGSLQQSWQIPPLSNPGFTYLPWHTGGRNYIPTVVNQSEAKTSFHCASNADEAQETQSRYTSRTMTDTLPPSYYTGGFEF